MFLLTVETRLFLLNFNVSAVLCNLGSLRSMCMSAYLLRNMQVSQLYGFVLAILMGFTLGLFGGGGSILAVPIFVYVFHIEPLLATAYSLWVVGLSALVGSLKKHLDQQIEYKVGLFFVVPSALTVFLTRRFLVPQIPLQLLALGDVTLTKNMAIMLFFGVVMILASYSMIRGITMHHSGTEPCGYCPRNL